MFLGLGLSVYGLVLHGRMNLKGATMAMLGRLSMREDCIHPPVLKHQVALSIRLFVN